MNQLKKKFSCILVTAIILAMANGCTTGHDTNSSSSQNHGNVGKELEESGYY
jgi:hypothetical protein